jgi:hypothetical protein
MGRQRIIASGSLAERPTLGYFLPRLAAGFGLVALGAYAFSQTFRFAPWSLWRLGWPLLVIGAGVLLLSLGGRNSIIAGLATIGFGLLFLAGTIGILTWLAISTLWPLALILPGLLILGSCLRGR